MTNTLIKNKIDFSIGINHYLIESPADQPVYLFIKLTIVKLNN